MSFVGYLGEIDAVSQNCLDQHVHYFCATVGQRLQFSSPNFAVAD